MNEGNQVKRQDLTSLALAIKQSVLKDLHVCDLYIVETVKPDEIVCHSINNVSDKAYAILVDGLTVETEDIVLIVFTDHEFKTNLRRVKSEANIQTITERATHSKTNAIAIAKINKGEE